MGVQFHHVLAREGTRGLEIQKEPFIEHRAGAVREPREVDPSRRHGPRQALRQATTQREGARARQPENANATRGWAGGRRDDGRRLKPGLPVLPRAARSTFSRCSSMYFSTAASSSSRSPQHTRVDELKGAGDCSSPRSRKLIFKHRRAEGGGGACP